MNVLRPSTISAHDDALTHLRTRYIQALAIFTIVIIPAATVYSIMQSGALTVETLPRSAGFMLLCGVLLALVRFKRLGAATIGLVGFYVVGTLSIGFTTPWAFLGIALVVVSSAILVSGAFYVAANVVVLGKLGWDTYQAAQLNPAPDITPNLVWLIALVVVSLATRYVIGSIQRAAQSAERNASLLRATATVGQLTATLLNMDELLARAVELIRDQFAFYHVQVFLVNELGDQAILAASTGEVGQQLLERQHRLAVGSRSVIGRVTQSGEPALARDTDHDAVYYRNELLPNTRSELALPLLDSEKIIGALDVQSTRPDAFQPNDMQALQVLANQLATAIRNARLFEQQRLSAQENKRFFLEAEANLREIQRLNQQLTKTGWADFLRDYRTRSGVTLEADRVVQDAGWSETLVAASAKREPITRTNGDGRVIAVPVMLRGEVIGAIEVEPGTEVNEADAVDMVQAVAQRLAVSLDNARLFEEAQVATAQEQHINAIVSQYQSVTSVDDLLRITLTELSQSLGAQRGAIRLGSAPQETLNGGHT
jgi:GAF domain-containing protein